MEALASLGQTVYSMSAEYGQRKGKEEGAKAGMAAGTQAAIDGTPVEPKETGFFSTVYDDAYNASMKSAYIAGVESNLTTKLATIAAESGPNAQLFNARASEAIKGMSQNVHPEMKGLFDASANQLFNSYSGKIQVAEANMNFENSKEVLVNSGQEFLNTALNFTKAGDPEVAETYLMQFDMTADAMANSRHITLESAQELKRKARKAVVFEQYRFGLGQQLQSGSIRAASTFIQAVEQSQPEHLNTEETRQMVDQMRSDMSQYLSLSNAQEAQTEKAMKQLQEQTTVDLTLGILDGSKGIDDIRAAAMTRSIDDTQLSTLSNLVNNRGTGVDNYSLVFQINDLMADSPEAAMALIRDNAGTNLTQETALNLYKSTMERQDTASPLNTYAAKSALQRIKDYNVIPGPMGAFDRDELVRYQDFKLVFEQRVLAGENPTLVASEMVNLSKLRTHPKYKRFDSDKQFQDAKNALNEDKKLNKLSDAEWIKQSKELDYYRTMLSDWTMFQKDVEKAERLELKMNKGGQQ